MSKPRSVSRKPEQPFQVLAVLNKIGKSLIDVQDPQKVLNQIAKDAKVVLGADIVDLYEYNQVLNEFVLPPIQVGTRRDPNIPKIEIHDDDVVVKIVKGGRPKYFPDAKNAKLLTGKFEVLRENTPDKRFVIREGVVSSVSLPLKAGEETVGVMFVNYLTRQKFEAEQKNLIESFSNFAAIAIHNARLWEMQKERTKLSEGIYAERNRQFNAIEGIVNAIGATSEPLPIILYQVVDLFKADYGAIGLFTPKTREITFYAIWEDGKLLTGDSIPEDKQLISGEKSIMLQVATTGEAYLVSDVRKDTHYKKWYSATRSELGVPLRDVNKNVIGVLDLESKRLQAFTNADETFCMGLANVIVTILEKSNLLNASRRLNRQLELVHGVVGEQNVQTVLTHVLEALNEVGGVGTSSSINLYDEGTDSFYSILAAGEYANALKIPPRPDGTCRHVVKNRAPLYIDDALYESKNLPSDRPTIRDEAVKEGVKSYAALPLIRNEHVLGVLFIHKMNSVSFTQDFKQLLETFASQAAIAVENARAYERSLQDVAFISKLNKQLEFLHQVVSEQDLDTLIKRILESVIQLMGEGTSSSMNLYDSVTKEFTRILAKGELEEHLLTPPRPGGTARYVVRNKESLYIDDVLNPPPGYPTLRSGAVDLGIRSFAAIPLIRKDRVLGVFFVHQKNPINFSNEIKQMLETFASQAAIAIENAQVYERRVQDIASMQQINDAISAGILNEDQILDIVVKEATQVMQVEYGEMWLKDSATGDLNLKAFKAPPNMLRPEVNRIGKNENSINIEVLNSGEYKIVNDASGEPGFLRIYPNSQSSVTAPLRFHNDVLGTLNVESTLLNAFSDQDARLLDSFADQAAIAIKSAQNIEEIKKREEKLYRQGEELYHMNYRLERRNSSFEALTEIGQLLTANIQRGEREILSIIHHQASRIMDTGNMYIALYEPEKDKVHFELAFIDGTPVDIQNEQDWAPRSGGNGRTEWIIRNRTPILTYTKVDADNWYNQPDALNYIGQTFASWLGVPIMFGDEVLGVIATYHKTEEYKYDPDDLRILSLMGRQAAIALQNARLIERLDTMRELGEDLSSALSV
jgi:GAF domain-containing protein